MSETATIQQRTAIKSRGGFRVVKRDPVRDDSLPSRSELTLLFELVQRNPAKTKQYLERVTQTTLIAV